MWLIFADANDAKRLQLPPDQSVAWTVRLRIVYMLVHVGRFGNWLRQNRDDWRFPHLNWIEDMISRLVKLFALFVMRSKFGVQTDNELLSRYTQGRLQHSRTMTQRHLLICGSIGNSWFFLFSSIVCIFPSVRIFHNRRLRIDILGYICVQIIGDTSIYRT